MTREQLDAIRARVEAATPGPWLVDSCLDVYTEQAREIDPDIGIELYKTVYSHHTAGPEGTQPWHDTHFMAHAREDVPALLAEVERLTSVCARYRDELSSSHDDFDEARKQVNELSDKVERLTAERDELVRWREGWLAVDEMCESVAIAAAFQRGVVAMREAVALAVLPSMAHVIRALPDPEDK